MSIRDKVIGWLEARVRGHQREEVNAAAHMFGLPFCEICGDALGTNPSCAPCLEGASRLQRAVAGAGVSVEQAAAAFRSLGIPTTPDPFSAALARQRERENS